MIVPRFSYCDMDEETRKFVVDTCREAYKRQHDGELKYYKDLAIHVKKTLDNSAKCPGAWHVIVGKFQQLNLYRNEFWILCQLRKQMHKFVLARTYRLSSF